VRPPPAPSPFYGATVRNFAAILSARYAKIPRRRQPVRLEADRFLAHTGGMEKTIALTFVIAIVLLAGGYTLWALKGSSRK
jgi:hypothetical protein